MTTLSPMSPLEQLLELRGADASGASIIEGSNARSSKLHRVRPSGENARVGVG